MQMKTGEMMKTNLDKVYKTDKECETEGIWIQVTDTVAFRLKRFGGYNSQSVRRVMAQYNKKFARQIENGTLPEETERKVYAKAFVQSAMVDWRGVEVDGVETPFSEEKAIELLLNLPDLLELLTSEASKSDNYREELGNC